MPTQRKSKAKPKPIQVHTNERVVDLLVFIDERRAAGKDDKYIARELGVTPQVLKLAIERAKQNGDTTPKSTSEERKSRAERRQERHRELVAKVTELVDHNVTNVDIAKQLGISESTVFNILKKESEK